MNYQDPQRLRDSQGRPKFASGSWILPLLSIWPGDKDCWEAMVVVREKHRQIGGLSKEELNQLLEYFALDPEVALERWFGLKPPGAKPGAKPQILATTGQSLEDLGL